MANQDKETEKVEAAAFAAGGAAAGAIAAVNVGNMGLVLAGGGMAIGAAPVIAAGAVVGLAAYSVKKLFS